MPVNHAVTIHMPDIVLGENSLPCTLHLNENIILVWDGTYFSLTDQEANDPAFGEVTFTYV